MKTLKQFFTTVTLLGTLNGVGYAQINCGSSEANQEMLNISFNRNERIAYEEEIRQFLADHKNLKDRGATYTIPVVFHVYGGPTHTFWGKTVTDQKVINALNEVNKDFNGLNDDYNSTDPAFANIKGKLSIEFCLAKKDPNGNPTTGIDYKSTTGAGYGNGSGYDAQIAADAWNCKKYMNVYIVADLYNDGGQYNSGVAWYPNTNMSNANTARVVYNGQYLGSNTSKEFASVLTHEFGHWLNLIHTFEGGCSGTGDAVADTPADNTNSGACSARTSCSSMENYENYMDYTDCYKMFTNGQADRMTATLNSSVGYRKELWQPSNLLSAGCQTAPLEANFLTSATIILPGQSITFTDASVTTTGNITAWSWSFTGGNPASASTKGPHTIAYNTVGTYSITLTVTNPSSTPTTASVTKTITVANVIPPCDPIGGQYHYQYIKNVTCAGINNSSTASAGGGAGSSSWYTAYLNISGVVSPGQTYPMTVSIDGSGATDPNAVVVFIDWNQDGDFSDVNEKTNPVNITGNGTVNCSITVPGGLAVSKVRMRVFAVYVGSPCTPPTDGCGPICESGEIEDYSLNVTVGVDQPESIFTNVNISPNPSFNGLFTIYFAQKIKDPSFTIFDICGNLIRSEKQHDAQELILNLTDLAKGTYFIQISGNNKNVTKKIMILD